jgi:hypothetical protein
MLTLSEVEQRHNGRLLVLRRIPFEYLIDELIVLLSELEGYAGIIFGGISMLCIRQLVSISIPSSKCSARCRGR